MWISRLRVNGGFLNGLDISLAPGLNVIIGPRGVGKTTLLELIRHGLGLPLPATARKRGIQRSGAELLAGGEVVLDLESDVERLHIVVDFEGNGRRELVSASALMLGQNELETIAADPSSRLELIDLRAGVSTKPWPTDDLAVATAGVAELKARLIEMTEDLEQSGSLEGELHALRQEEQRLLESANGDLTSMRNDLERIERDLQLVQGEQRAGAAAVSEVERVAELERALRDAVLDLRDRAGHVAVQPILFQVGAEAAESLRRLTATLADAQTALRAAMLELAEREDVLRVSAAPIRAQLDRAESGLGHLTTRIRNLEQLLARLGQARIEADELIHRLDDRIGHRNDMLDERDSWQETIYRERRLIADSVSARLESQVVVVVEHLADVESFQDGLQRLLRSSSVQSRSTAQAIVRSVLPRQLLSLVEDADVAGLASAARLTEDRASRVIAHLSDGDSVAELATFLVDDYVDFRLRDGATTKSVDELSSGQKCAVTLPIFLTEDSRSLILDQPEDHLDNAYLVSHVVTGMLRRSTVGAQTIVATHNANIPVLGSADRVFAMQSDGLRGSVAVEGRYDNPAVVERITSLMEGGLDAFARRAEFYRQFGSGE